MAFAGINTLENFCLQDSIVNGAYEDEKCEMTVKVNEASRNTIVSRTNFHGGTKTAETFLKPPQGGIRYRDPKDVSDDCPPIGFGTDKTNCPKIDWGYGPVGTTFDALRKQGFCGAGGTNSLAGVNSVVGRGLARESADYQYDVGVGALVAALLGNPAAVIDQQLVGGAAGDGFAITHDLFIFLQSVYGECSSKIRAWLGPSDVYFALWQTMSNSGDSNLCCDGLRDIYSGGVPFAGKPYIIDNSPHLRPEPGKYLILALCEGALAIDESEELLIHSDVSGGCNIKWEYQAEGAFDVCIKGYDYIGPGGGTASTSDVDVQTVGNWEMKYDYLQNTAGLIACVQCDGVPVPSVCEAGATFYGRDVELGDKV